jgi:hypothetical protein
VQNILDSVVDHNAQDSGTRLWIEVFFFGCVIASLLLSEVVVNNLATYFVSDNAILTFTPLFVFTGISLGNLLQLLPMLGSVGRFQWILWSALTCLLGYSGCYYLPSFIPFFIVLAFTGFGSYLSYSYSRLPMKVLVLGFSLGGLGLTITMAALYSWIAPHLAEISIGLILLGLSAERSKKAFYTGFLGLAVAMLVLGAASREERFQILGRIEGFSNAQKVMASIYTPLIRTDVYKSLRDRYLIVTNGRRFAPLLSAEAYRHFLDLSKNMTPSHETPYIFVHPQKVLVIGSAEGANLIAAQKHGASDVTAVDINPAVIRLMTGELKDVSGGVYLHPSVHPVVDEGRHFLETTKDQYDLITFQGVQTGSHSNFVNPTLLESYLLTVESLRTSWRHLTGRGCLWIDEYKWPIQSDEGETTLVRTVRKMAKKALDIHDFDSQSYFFEYYQPRENPSGRNRKMREALLLCKSPLEVGEKALSELRDRNIYRADSDEATAGSTVYINDQHPYFVASNALVDILRTTSLVLLLALLSLAIYSGVKAPAAELNRMALFCVGVGFILLISAAMGMSTLLLGDPQIATPVIFVSVYASGLLGGLLALKVSHRCSTASLLALSSYLFLLPFGIALFKPSLLSWESLGARVLVFVVGIAPVGLLAELPYIWLLKSYEKVDRARAYAIENFGTLLGVPIGIYVQIRYGFYATFMLSGLFYALAWLLIISQSRVRNARFAWLLVSGLCLVALPVLVSRPKAVFPSPQGALAKQTEGCRGAEPESEIGISRKNAELLRTKNEITALISPEDGCYMADQPMVFLALHREPETRKILSQEERGDLMIKNIQKTRFIDLSRTRQEYLVKKWKQTPGNDKIYDIVTLRRLNLFNGHPTDAVPSD